ncbi:uncharacterized protein TRUGW13939_11567 [Talaromyces rugulosus]|uniref:CCHC-type domain-containing protein n=2 Tax=Talaromyces rugulosus TaxID=121627 RepID=A0A7H8RIF4_TALRU|nr:uncharacterized protein TRUGW13939_04830 [Talaromyces rugulosus]XP_035348763.1 uncharacterized protein TRUGW13939_09750 [Talaromyces rugulosus]XP_035350566.1 uncharacterized protein TRUGW13939_11567 [Talaromyces rugulosus]QKX57712.1 hypothetical protein TRUGW13939_04830 [Talaromyces rugulosus]QKX62589.1 hypothetical protein TRUGW13939_09750 [Talaromyces rugulosus]QKX64393.1 hypothetical protein TRUGW13939_11567 [Talaromyces rugulosus]
MVTTRSTPIPTDTTERSVPAAEIQPSMSETLDGHGNREEPAVELEGNHPTSEDLDLGMVRPPPEQELEDMSMEELEAMKTQLDQELHIANLKRQILQTRAQLRGAPAHENQDTGTPDSSAHGEKRPRTDTIPAEKRPSRFKMKDPYSGKSLTELETFIGRAESWFGRYPEWYSQYPHHKVGEASDNLSSKQFLNFNMYRKEKEPEPITWEDFKAHLRRLFHDPELLRIAATRDHNDARQLEGQSVWEFARYLRTLEDQMDMQYSEEQRMKLLMVKVLRPIQDESQKYPEKPRTYEGTVQFLQKLEDAMPERQKTRNSRRRDGHGSSGNEYRAAPNHRRAGARPPMDKRGKDDQFPRRDEAAAGRSSGGNPKGKERGKPKGDRTGSTCNYCGKVGHWERECYKKGFDEARKASEPSKN